jgi:hypothetical protein
VALSGLDISAACCGAGSPSVTYRFKEPDQVF